MKRGETTYLTAAKRLVKENTGYTQDHLGSYVDKGYVHLTKKFFPSEYVHTYRFFLVILNGKESGIPPKFAESRNPSNEFKWIQSSQIAEEGVGKKIKEFIDLVEFEIQEQI